MNPNTSSSAGSQFHAPEEIGRTKASDSCETRSFQAGASEPGQETNWDKFQKFLKEYLSAILELEQQNQSGIHLFAHNGTWLAFDRSARRLKKIFPEQNFTTLTLPQAQHPSKTVMLQLTPRQTDQLKASTATASLPTSELHKTDC